MSSNFGVNAWGIVTVILAAAALIIVIGVGGYYVEGHEKFAEGTPRWIAGLYTALKDCGNVVAGILGFSGLAWSNFYKAWTDTKIAEVKALTPTATQGEGQVAEAESKVKPTMGS